jgi:glyceraldehyde-3-phosphate dehydrogenase (NADP+)
MGRTVVPPLMRSGKIDALAFIGSSKAANSLQKEHPKPHRLRLVLGLEAKNPAIVLPDADLELAVAECVVGSLSFNGQRCTALKILFVHESIAVEFVDRFSSALATLGIGLPWEPEVMITPLPDQEKPNYLTELLEDAKNFGAKVMNDEGGRVNNTFFYPALLFPVNDKMRVYYEEQFGPIIPIVPFNEIETPIRYIEESIYGQQVSIFGRDPRDIAKLIDHLVNQVSRINLNSQCQRGPDLFPFTGRKDSAVGTLSVSDALRAFSIRAIVAAKDFDLNKQIISDITREHRSNFLSTDFIL